ncbi:unnamed protein product [Rhizophagus irregularis]|nr:unnamed protein product [Rhizophagus irregularis]
MPEVNEKNIFGLRPELYLFACITKFFSLCSRSEADNTKLRLKMPINRIVLFLLSNISFPSSSNAFLS